MIEGTHRYTSRGLLKKPSGFHQGEDHAISRSSKLCVRKNVRSRQIVTPTGRAARRFQHEGCQVQWRRFDVSRNLAKYVCLFLLCWAMVETQSSIIAKIHAKNFYDNISLDGWAEVNFQEVLPSALGCGYNIVAHHATIAAKQWLP